MATRKATQIEDAAGNLYDVKDAAAQADITELKSAIKALLPLINIKPIVFNQYGINYSGGNVIGNDARLHTPMIYAREGDIVFVPSGYKYWIAYYDLTNGYFSNSYDEKGDWSIETEKITHTGLFTLNVKKDDESDFTKAQCLALNETAFLYSAIAQTVADIPFGVGHLEGSDNLYWSLDGNDYYFNSWSDQKQLNTTRWRSEKKVKFVKGASVEIANGYRFYIKKYVNGTPVGTQWYTGKYVFTEDTIARLLLDVTSDTKVAYTGWPELSTILTIKNNADIIELEDSTGLSSISTAELNKDMGDALVAASRYDTYASGDWANPASKKKNLSFAVITDIHGSSDALNRFIEYTNKKKKYFDFCMGLGDFVVRQPSESTGWIDSAIVNAEIPFYYTVGNHDSADTGLSGITQASARTKYFSTIETKGWLESTDFMDSGKCSWTKDFSSYKIRIISLFEYGNADTIASGADGAYCRRWMDSELLQWFADTLYSTPDGYSVIVLLHQVPYNSVTYEDSSFTASHGFRQEPPHFLNTVDGNPIEEIVDAFINSTSISKTYNSIAEYELGKTAFVAKDFSDRNEDGKFVCYFCGHAHTAYVLVSQNYPNQKTVVVNTGSENIYQRQYGDIMYDVDTRNKDSFYCIGIDTELEKVNLVQIGGQTTVDMRERTIATVSY